MTRSSPIRVVLADDHAVVRSGLGAVLKAHDDLCLVGEAGSGEQAVRLCEEHRPDVVVMDLVMPGMDGVAATRAILERCPETRVLVLTSFKEKGLVRRALAAGAVSYVLKNISADQFVAAVRSTMGGHRTVSPEAMEALIQPGTEPAPDEQCLTPREHEVLALVATGLTNAQISERLIVTESTVRYHVGNIMSKLRVSSRTEAATLALRNGLVA